MKTKHHGYKTFLSALEHVHVRPVETKKFLNDNRLTTQEKKLIVLYMKIRESDFSYIDALREDSSFSNFPFLNGFRYYFLAVSYVNKGDSKKAESYMAKAMPLLTECYNDKFFHRLHFHANMGLFYAYVNQKKLDHLEKHYKKIQLIKASNTEEKIYLGLMDACYHLLINKYAEAEEYLEELGTKKKSMNHIQIMSYLVESFDFCVKIDQYERAALVLEEMKNHRTFRLSANFKYMDKLLKFIHKNERFYFYEKDFEDHQDIYLMINVIKSLDEGDFSSAEKSWMQLSEASPKIYKSNFSYHGDKCLFSICLAKCLRKDSSNKTTSDIDLSKFTKQEVVVIKALMDSGMATLKKEELFLTVYGKEAESKEDLMTMTAVIYRINKKNVLAIKSKKGCYCLELQLQKAS